MTTYAVTGASGQLGALVAERLLAVADPSDVVLLSRSPEKLERFEGATVRAADFSDAESLDAAFAGVDELLLVSIDVVGPERIALQRAAVEAAVRAGVRRVVYTSLPKVEEGNPALVAPDHLATEQALRESGLRWTFLRNNLYTDSSEAAIGQAVETGQLVTSTGDGAAAYVTREQCADAAVAALLSTELDDVARDVTGPQALTADDLAAQAAERRGSAVEVVQVDDATREAGLVDAGLPAPVAALLVSFDTAVREGYLADVGADL